MRYNAELTGNIIKVKRQKNNLSQRALGECIGVTGKQISNYEKGTPMPPIDVLLKLCEVFDCELGYLLGEEQYTDETKLKTAILKETGLSSDALQNIQYVTGNRHESERYRKIINDFLSSHHFISLIEDLAFLSEKSSTPDIYWSELEEKYGKNVIDKAYEYYQSTTDYLHDSNAPKLSEEYYKAIADIEHTINLIHDNEYSIKVARYEVSESFSALIESIYPKF